MTIHGFSEEMRRRFGCKVWKLALDGGFTCPNRDGTLDSRGCSFCAGGSGSFAEGATGGVEAQLERAKARVAFKAGPNARYVAYFQSYTNTYAPVERLRALYAPLAEREDLAAISIGTRPDCLGPEVLDLLAELNERKPVWVELGLQTIHEETARAIRRGYPLPVFDAAMRGLEERGLERIVHVILGLPGETADMCRETVSYVARARAEGIKLQLLHVLEGTSLAEDWRAGRYVPLTLEEYMALLAVCVRLLPPRVTLHRLTGDGDKRLLLAPLWSADKKQVLARVRAAFAEWDVVQGSACKEDGSCPNQPIRS